MRAEFCPLTVTVADVTFEELARVKPPLVTLRRPPFWTVSVPAPFAPFPMVMSPAEFHAEEGPSIRTELAPPGADVA